MYLADTETLQHPPRLARDNARLARLLRLTPQFEILTRDNDLRTDAEICIHDRFLDAFGAELQTFLPILLSMKCANRLSGIAGISQADRQDLFLEQYLDAPVEQALALAMKEVRVQSESPSPAINHTATTDSNFARNSIVEIGNLVAASNGASLAIFVVLAGVLSQAGFTHMVFTATEKLRSKFDRLGYETLFLADADPRRLASENLDSWGSYYANKPQVIAGQLSTAMSLIKSRPLFASIAMAFSGQIQTLAQQLERQRVES